MDGPRIVLEGPTAMSIGQSSSDRSTAPAETTHTENEKRAEDASDTPRFRRLRVLLASVLSFAIFWYAGWILRVPASPGFSGSLLQQPSPMGAMLIVAGVFVACAILSSWITGGGRTHAGTMCAAVGVFALSSRSGPMRYTLMAGAGPQVYLALACELIALGGIVLLAEMAQGVLAPAPPSSEPAPAPNASKPARGDDQQQIDQKLIGVLTALIAMTLLMLLLSQSDKKQQVVAAVAIASFVAALMSAAYFISPRAGAGWFLIVPIAIGVIGYLGTYFTNPAGWNIGVVRGFLAPLARPLPLDYASVGVASAIFAHRIARAWQINHADGKDEESHESHE
jgi:hypothetical protein